MMKKIMGIMLAVVLIMQPVCALAADFDLDDRAVLSGMDKSWLQGYEPEASGENLTIYLPVTSEASDGKLTATLMMDDEALSPIRTQKLSAVFWRSEGIFQVKLSFRLSASRMNGDYTGRILLEGKDREGGVLLTEYPVTIRIRDAEKDEGMTPEFEEVSLSLSEGEGIIAVGVMNPGRITPMESVYLTVEDESGGVLPVGSDTMRLDDIAPGKTAYVKFPVMTSGNSEETFHRIKLTLGYTALGIEDKWSETFTIPAKNAAGTMRPEINDVLANLTVGESGSVTASIKNPGETVMEDVLLTVTDESGDVLPAGSDVLRLSDIAPGEAVHVDYQAVVLPDAAVSPHPMTFEVCYSLNGNEEKWTESFTLPVIQEIRLEQGGVQLAGSIIQGDMATLTLPLMNMGKGNLMNVMATLTMSGVTDGQSVLVGTIAPGETGQAKISFTPGKSVLGEISGEVLVTAEDAWGNPTSFTLPVSIVVEEPVKSTQAGARTEEEEKPDYLLYGLMGACALMGISLILQGSLLRRKIYRMEEERL